MTQQGTSFRSLATLSVALTGSLLSGVQCRPSSALAPAPIDQLDRTSMGPAPAAAAPRTAPSRPACVRPPNCTQPVCSSPNISCHPVHNQGLAYACETRDGKTGSIYANTGVAECCVGQYANVVEKGSPMDPAGETPATDGRWLLTYCYNEPNDRR